MVLCTFPNKSVKTMSVSALQLLYTGSVDLYKCKN